MPLRLGHGYDIHRLVAGRPLVLGGGRFDTDFGLEGHSDADCATHAIVAEKPRIFPQIDAMKGVLARSAGLPIDAIGLKATTNEGVGELGRGVAIAAHAVALIEKV